MEWYNRAYKKNFDTKLWQSYTSETPYTLNFQYVTMQMIGYEKNQLKWLNLDMKEVSYKSNKFVLNKKNRRSIPR